jgi:hypothetical protein
MHFVLSKQISSVIQYKSTNIHKLDHQLEDIIRVGFYLLVKLVLYINISTYFGQLQATNIKLITVLYTFTLLTHSLP